MIHVQVRRFRKPHALGDRLCILAKMPRIQAIGLCQQVARKPQSSLESTETWLLGNLLLSEITWLAWCRSKSCASSNLVLSELSDPCRVILVGDDEKGFVTNDEEEPLGSR